MSRSFTQIDDPLEVDVVTAEQIAPDAAIVRIVEAERTVEVLLATELVAVLAERTGAIVDELEARGLAAITPAAAARKRRTPPRDADLAFPAQTVLVGWEDEIDRVVVEAWSPIDEDGAGDVAPLPGGDAAEDVVDDDPLGPDVIRLRMTTTMAADFARRATVVGREAGLGD